jgi:hypothetical protein
MEKLAQNTAAAAKTWTAPRLAKLGTIADVAGAETPRAQASGNVKS